MSFLEIANIDVAYGDIEVLFDVSLYIEKGEVLSVIGANGAGKTTTLKTISGLLHPKKGSIIFNDKRIDNLSPEIIVERGIIHVPEGRRLFPFMSVEENLEMGSYNSRAYDDRFETMKKVFDLFPRLKERRRQLAGTLSGGERQMVAVGRGLMAKPEILMFDEPSLGLAPILVKDMMTAIKEIADKGTTIILVEQNIHASLNISNRAYVLEQGYVVNNGDAKQLLDDPSVQKAFLGI
ncbi:MAG: ABC transporter ATP-binding protein [Epsilonproteobacteria bacterium]|nr:ABC transporter ATP-binding protein [Campylobacterota bacterium]